MEAGILLHFLAGLAYRAAAICVVVNKRREGTFMSDYRRHVVEAARIALRALNRQLRGSNESGEAISQKSPVPGK